MIRTRCLAAAVAVAAAAVTVSTASPALAKSAPPPTPAAALFCPPDLQNGQSIQEPDGSMLFCVEALGAGAVVARTGVFLDHVIVAPGWDWAFGGGGQGKVDIKFHNATTGGNVEVRIEPGKTEVKGN